MKTISGLLLLLVMLISGCDNGSKIAAGKYGMMSEDTPQYTAILFMNAIYNDDDIQLAVKLSTTRYGRTIASYHTTRTVQRQLFNLRLESATLEPVSGGTMIYSDKQKTANIEMKIIGHFNNDKVIDLRTVSMIKEKGEWRISGVKNTIP